MDFGSTDFGCGKEWLRLPVLNALNEAPPHLPTLKLWKFGFCLENTENKCAFVFVADWGQIQHFAPRVWNTEPGFETAPRAQSTRHICRISGSWCYVPFRDVTWSIQCCWSRRSNLGLLMLGFTSLMLRCCCCRSNVGLLMLRFI